MTWLPMKCQVVNDPILSASYLYINGWVCHSFLHHFFKERALQLLNYNSIYHSPGFRAGHLCRKHDDCRPLGRITPCTSSIMVIRSCWKTPVPHSSLTFDHVDRVEGAHLVIPLFIFRFVGQTKIIGCPAEMSP